MSYTEAEKREIVEYFGRNGSVKTTERFGYETPAGARIAAGLYRNELRRKEQCVKLKTCLVCNKKYDYNRTGKWLYCSDSCERKAKNQSAKSYYGRGAFLGLA